MDLGSSPHEKWNPGQLGAFSVLLLRAVNSDSPSLLPASLLTANGRRIAPVFTFAFYKSQTRHVSSYSFRKLKVSF